MPLRVELVGRSKLGVTKLRVDVGCESLNCTAEVSGLVRVPKTGNGAAASTTSKRFKLEASEVAVPADDFRRVRMKLKGRREAFRRIDALLERASKRERKRAKAIIRVKAGDPVGAIARAKHRIRLTR